MTVSNQMDWLFSNETATLFVLVGCGLFALMRHLYGRYWPR
jgi:hypothetical protein